MWNPEKNRIFVHLRKTGGTSVSEALGDVERLEEKHLGPAGYVAKYGREVWDRAFTFTVIRNPWDALVSDYFFAKRLWGSGTTKGTKQKLANELSFGQWVQRYSTHLYRGLQNRDGIITLKNGVCTINGVEYAFNTIIKYEELEQKILELPFELAAPLGQRNCTYHEHWSSYWAPAQIRLVEQQYGSLIEEFGWGLA